jgi:hypothetical protein
VNLVDLSKQAGDMDCRQGCNPLNSINLLIGDGQRIANAEIRPKVGNLWMMLVLLMDALVVEASEPPPKLHYMGFT